MGEKEETEEVIPNSVAGSDPPHLLEFFSTFYLEAITNIVNISPTVFSQKGKKITLKR